MSLVKLGNASLSAGVIGVTDCADKLAEVKISSDVSERLALKMVPLVGWLSVH